MTKVAGVELAPLNVPLERRIQTLAVFQWVLWFLIGGFGCLFFNIYLLVFTSYAWIPCLYIVWYMFDRHTQDRGGRRNEWFRNWVIWKKFRDFFPIGLHKTATLDPKKNYIIALHPHGVMSIGGFLNFATNATGFNEMFPGIRPHLLTLAGQYQFPFHREYLMTSGACSASKDSITWILTKQGQGNAAILITGGAIEALNAHPGNFNLILAKRKGFVKLALQLGALLVPAFSFGENDLYDQMPNEPGTKVRKMQEVLSRHLGFSVPIFHGRGIFNYTFGILPYRRPVNTVIGAPIDVDQKENPTQEDLDSLHKIYVDALIKLFNENKTKFGIDKDQHLNII